MLPMLTTLANIGIFVTIIGCSQMHTSKQVQDGHMEPIILLQRAKH